MKQTRTNTARVLETDPTEADAELARQSNAILSRHVDESGRMAFEIQTGTRRESVVIPTVAVRLIVDILSEIGKDNKVSLVASKKELTTQQAADALNVSRPYLIGLLDQKKIASRKVGNRRRVVAEDLFRYREASDAECRANLDELVRESERLGLY